MYAATTSRDKMRELRALFAPFGWELDVFDAYVPPAEGQTSYGDNAALKARALAAQLRDAGVSSAAVVADDSGIEVDALGRRPGVLSARYAGEDAPWGTRLATLLDELARTGSPDRRGRFVCAMHFVGSGGEEFAVEGSVEGEIAHSPRGHGGFGYDPIFYYPPLARAFAELTAEEKNAVSHRARAARALATRVLRPE